MLAPSWQGASQGTEPGAFTVFELGTGSERALPVDGYPRESEADACSLAWRDEGGLHLASLCDPGEAVQTWPDDHRFHLDGDVLIYEDGSTLYSVVEGVETTLTHELLSWLTFAAGEGRVAWLEQKDRWGTDPHQELAVALPDGTKLLQTRLEAPYSNRPHDPAMAVSEHLVALPGGQWVVRLDDLGAAVGPLPAAKSVAVAGHRLFRAGRMDWRKGPPTQPLTVWDARNPSADPVPIGGEVNGRDVVFSNGRVTWSTDLSPRFVDLPDW